MARSQTNVDSAIKRSIKFENYNEIITRLVKFTKVKSTKT